jgi:6-phosphogluconate dehydrogenase
VPERGWLHCGSSGAGHFAKMIHNGIEYGIMQSLAEGFALLAARPELDIDVARLAETWRHGSVVRSWLLDLCAEILARARSSRASRRWWPTRAKGAGPRSNRSSSACPRR